MLSQQRITVLPFLSANKSSQKTEAAKKAATYSVENIVGKIPKFGPQKRVLFLWLLNTSCVSLIIAILWETPEFSEKYQIQFIILTLTTFISYFICATVWCFILSLVYVIIYPSDNYSDYEEPNFHSKKLKKLKFKGQKDNEKLGQLILKLRELNPIYAPPDVEKLLEIYQEKVVAKRLYKKVKNILIHLFHLMLLYLLSGNYITIDMHYATRNLRSVLESYILKGSDQVISNQKVEDLILRSTFFR